MSSDFTFPLSTGAEGLLSSDLDTIKTVVDLIDKILDIFTILQ